MSRELDAIQALYANYETKAVMLSASSIAVLFYGLERIKPLYVWKDGATDEITESDADEIQRIVDLAFTEVMQELTLYAPPIGTIQMFANATPPTGWLNCDHSSLLREDYPDLFAVVGTVWGAIDSDHFNLPDFRTRFPVGIGTLSSTTYTVGTEGGINTVQLAVNHLPAHSHQIGRGNNTGSGILSYTSQQQGAIANYAQSEETGGNAAHENRPPFAAVNFIIYAGV